MADEKPLRKCPQCGQPLVDFVRGREKPRAEFGELRTELRIVEHAICTNGHKWSARDEYPDEDSDKGGND